MMTLVQTVPELIGIRLWNLFHNIIYQFLKDVLCEGTSVWPTSCTIEEHRFTNILLLWVKLMKTGRRPDKRQPFTLGTDVDNCT